MGPGKRISQSYCKGSNGLMYIWLFFSHLPTLQTCSPSCSVPWKADLLRGHFLCLLCALLGWPMRALVGGWRADRERGWSIYSPPASCAPVPVTPVWGPLSKAPALTGARNTCFSSCLLIFYNLFYWSTVDWQCCVNFCCTAKWFSDT